MIPYGDRDLGQHWLRQWLLALTIPNHYMDHNWIFVGEVQWHSTESNFMVSAQATVLYNEFEICTFKITATSPRGKWVVLTHWGRMTHICLSKLTSTVSDNGLSPGRHQAIVWTNTGILLIGPLGTNFSEILIGIRTFWFKKSVGKCRLENDSHFASASVC